MSAFAKTLAQVLRELGWTQRVAKERSGISSRTLSRWATKAADPDPRSLRSFLHAVASVDFAKAQLLAEASNIAIEKYGLLPAIDPGAQPRVVERLAPIAPRIAADAILCAAAEALDTSPKTLRPVVRAIIARTRASGVPLDLLEAALAEGD